MSSLALPKMTIIRYFASTTQNIPLPRQNKNNSRIETFTLVTDRQESGQVIKPYNKKLSIMHELKASGVGNEFHADLKFIERNLNMNLLFKFSEYQMLLVIRTLEKHYPLSEKQASPNELLNYSRTMDNIVATYIEVLLKRHHELYRLYMIVELLKKLTWMVGSDKLLKTGLAAILIERAIETLPQSSDNREFSKQLGSLIEIVGISYPGLLERLVQSTVLYMNASIDRMQIECQAIFIRALVSCSLIYPNSSVTKQVQEVAENLIANLTKYSIFCDITTYLWLLLAEHDRSTKSEKYPESLRVKLKELNQTLLKRFSQRPPVTTYKIDLAIVFRIICEKSSQEDKAMALLICNKAPRFSNSSAIPINLANLSLRMIQIPLELSPDPLPKPLKQVLLEDLSKSEDHLYSTRSLKELSDYLEWINCLLGTSEYSIKKDIISKHLMKTLMAREDQAELDPLWKKHLESEVSKINTQSLSLTKLLNDTRSSYRADKQEK